MKTNEFKEELNYRNKFVFGLLALLVLFFLVAVFRQVVLGKSVGAQLASDEGLFLITGLVGILLLLLMNMKLSLKVNPAGISYKFRPFHWKEQQIDWEEIEDIKVWHTGAHKKMRGHGIRLGWRKKTFSVGGDSALEINLLTEKTIYISSRKTEALEGVLRNLNKLGAKEDFKRLL